MKATVIEYTTNSGVSPFAEWFKGINAPAAAKVAAAIYRMENGNFSNVKSVKGRVYEYKIDFGPGYRIYLGQEGDTLTILLGGGTKKQQSKDIEKAKICWQDYKKQSR